MLRFKERATPYVPLTTALLGHNTRTPDLGPYLVSRD